MAVEMKHSRSRLTVAMARLPFVSKVLLALSGATLIVFLMRIPASHGFTRSSAADQAAPAPKAPPVAEAAQAEAKNENTLSQSPIRLERPEVRSNGTIKNGDASFVLSDITRFTRKDVCEAILKKFFRRPARTDLDFAALGVKLLPLKDIKLADYDFRGWAKDRDAVLQRVQEMILRTR